jgi:hypothetical protein
VTIRLTWGLSSTTNTRYAAMLESFYHGFNNEEDGHNERNDHPYRCYAHTLVQK